MGMGPGADPSGTLGALTTALGPAATLKALQADPSVLAARLLSRMMAFLSPEGGGEESRAGRSLH